MNQQLNQPFWHLEKWTQHNTTENKFDVAIVGAGIAGLSIAYWLEKKDPGLKIVIIDKMVSICRIP